jgi:hypothetical protein
MLFVKKTHPNKISSNCHLPSMSTCHLCWLVDKTEIVGSIVISIQFKIYGGHLLLMVRVFRHCDHVFFRLGGARGV